MEPVAEGTSLVVSYPALKVPGTFGGIAPLNAFPIVQKNA